MASADAIVTVVAGVLGVVILGVGIYKFSQTSAADTDKWPIIGVLAVGAFLLVGSQYKTFKITASGMEVVRDVAEAASDVATQTEQVAEAVQETQVQVNALTEALNQNRAFSPNLAAPMKAKLQSAQRIDLTKLRSAQRVLGRIQGR